MYYLEVIQETIGSTLMVFTSLVFLTLLVITIWLIAEDPRQFTIAISAIWEIISGTCRLHCRSKRNVEQGQDLKSLPLNNGQASKTFKQALGQTLEQEDMPNLGPTPGALDLGLASNPVTAEKVQESGQQTQTSVARSIPVDGERQVIKNCVCEPCACDVVENIVRTTKPAENAFYNFKESLVNSLVFQKLNDIYNHVATSYPAAIEYLEEDKIDSQENFYFLKTEEGQSKAGTLCKAVETNKRPLYKLARDNFEDEVNRRIQLGWAAFGKLRQVMTSSIPQCLKTKVFNQCVLPVMIRSRNVDTDECDRTPRSEGWMKKKYLCRYLPLAGLLLLLVFTATRVDPTTSPCPATSGYFKRLLYVFARPLARLATVSSNFVRQIVEIILDFFKDLFALLHNKTETIKREVETLSSNIMRLKSEITPEASKASIFSSTSNTSYCGISTNTSCCGRTTNTTCCGRTTNTALLKSRNFRRYYTGAVKVSGHTTHPDSEK